MASGYVTLMSQVLQSQIYDVIGAELITKYSPLSTALILQMKY